MPFGSAAPVPGMRVLSNADGQFVIRGLRPGTLVLLASRGGYLEAAHGQTRPAGHGQPIRVEAGQKYLDTDVRMWRGGGVTRTLPHGSREPVIRAPGAALPA